MYGAYSSTLRIFQFNILNLFFVFEKCEELLNNLENSTLFHISISVSSDSLLGNKLNCFVVYR